MFTFSSLRASQIKDLLLLLSTLLIFYLLHLHLHRHHHHLHHRVPTPPQPTTSPTALRHLLFSIAASSKTFPKRTPYVRLWYNPNSTRALVFLDRPSAAAPHSSLPQTLISAATGGGGSKSATRISRIVKEVVDRDPRDSDTRWFVFGDDDTVFFPDNLAKTLAKYDHDKWYYVGGNSESYEQNQRHAFGMAFGGGGFAISRPLARVLARVLDSCVMRYPHLYGSDDRVFACLSELGVGLSREPGFHQVDIRGDLFGMLSAHPLSPIVSLHHLERVDPIFPNMTQIQAVEHLFKAVNVEPGRILKQTVCYDSSKSLTVSIAWGYSVQVYEGNYLLPDLLSLQRTFRPWKQSKNILSRQYMFNTREYSNDPCQRPVVFFLDSVVSETNGSWTNYARHIVGNCSRNSSVQNLEKIRVFSQKLDYDSGEAPRRECCDILSSFNTSMVIGIRHCGIDELISMHT